jgi:molybdopterin synthase sulfur carrier subunit
MKVKVFFFAALREQLGTAAELVELAGERSSVAEVRAALAARGESWGRALTAGRLRVAVNQDLAQADTPVRAGDEIAFFPPVTGG